MRIAVIGAGKMGVWFAKFFQSRGYSVVLADRKQEKLVPHQNQSFSLTTNFSEAVKDADQVLLCVAIDAMEEVTKTISPALHKGQVVMDVCSVKQTPVEVMHRYIKDATVLGTHPVFGPGSNGIAHKAYILTPTNSEEEKFASEFKAWLEKEEAHVFVMSPKKHDELIAVVLGLPHFLGLVACETLLEQETLAETKKVSGTTYRMLYTLAEATALETPDLFASLQTSLPEVDKVEGVFVAKAQEWLDLIKRKDSAAIKERMAQLNKKLKQSDSNFTDSYEVMYKMLESTEK
ncbi:MAG: prephenate dehydrogenase/arogenate dehydrogenase family protein [Candidatus Bathyarchaeota archaeon]|nr:prephenate dehydrogenase/arogenate dehydrogenase family protein [Candidatus Bathyarchaeota archaeon]